MDRNVVVNANLLVSDANNWQLLLGRNVLAAIKSNLMDVWLYYELPRTGQRSRIPLYSARWKK